MNFSTRTELLPHQIPARDKVLPSRIGGLFMDMGTGKSRVSIELAYLRQKKIDRVVWFCPVTLRTTIRHEILKHTDTRFGCIHTFDDKTRKRTLPKSTFWYIIGIESMSASNCMVLAAASLITSRSFVIVDESSYIKGAHSKRTMRITAMAERARYRLILTGTPMSQGYEDLFAQIRFLSPKILGYHSFYSFAANHLEYSDKYPGLIVRAHNTDWLAAKIQPYVYQITKEDAGLNLPKKLYDSRYFHLTDEQQEAYEQAKWEILMDAEELDSYVIFQLFTALQQIVSGYWNRNGELLEFPHRRLETTIDLINSIGTDEKIIIWCKYQYSVRALTEALSSEFCPDAISQFHGQNERFRDSEVEHWRREGRFLVASMAAGSHGLTLNESAYSIFYENGFKYSDRLQSEDRNHRIGQGRRVTYIDISSVSGIESRISDSLAKKGNALNEFRFQVDKFKSMSRSEVKKKILEIL